MLNKIILSIFLIFTYFEYSIQTTVNPSNTINHIYHHEKCNFNILPIGTGELKEDIKKCDDIIENVLLVKEEGNQVHFRGKIHLSPLIFERLNEKTLNENIMNNIISQISMVFNNYRNTIYSWDINDDMMTNRFIMNWINDRRANEKKEDSIIILQEEDAYFTPYYHLLKEIFKLGNGSEQKLNLAYHHFIPLNLLNEEEDEQRLSILYQMMHHLMQESIPVQQLQFEFIQNSNKNDMLIQQQREEKIFQFISHLKLFTHANLPLNLLVPKNASHPQDYDYDRFLQKCLKNNIKCLFSLTDSINNYNPEFAYNLFENNNLSSYFNPSLNILTTQFYKRDIVNQSYNISFYGKNDNEVKSTVYDYDIQTQNLINIPDISYSEM